LKTGKLNGVRQQLGKSEYLRLSGFGEIQAEAIYVTGNTIYEEIIRSNKLYRRKTTVGDFSASPFILWQQGNWESWQEVNISQYPGSGDFQTLNAYIIGNQLAQGFWRGNKGYTRQIPVENGYPNGIVKLLGKDLLKYPVFPVQVIWKLK